jgi:hypothetical protein
MNPALATLASSTCIVEYFHMLSSCFNPINPLQLEAAPIAKQMSMYSIPRYNYYSLNLTDFILAKQQATAAGVQSSTSTSTTTSMGMSNCPMIRIKVVRTSTTGITRLDVSMGMPYLVTGTSACPEGQNPKLCTQGYAVSVR